MRIKIAILILFLTYQTSFSQNSIFDVKKSVIYVSYTYEDSIKVNYDYIFLKKILYDTIIENKNFSKIEWTKFKNYEENKIVFYEYEKLGDDEYILLDSNFETIHNIKLIPGSETTGIIFGKEGLIKTEYIDTRNKTPRDSLIPKPSTPLKFYIKNCEKNIIYRPHLNVVERFRNCVNEFKYLLDDTFAELSEGLKNTTPINSDFDLDIGDELQFLYRNKWYNDSTYEPEFRNKQLISTVYQGDTVIDNKKNLILTIENKSLTMGTEDAPKKTYVSLNDSGYFIMGEGIFPVPMRDFKPILKFDSTFINLSAYTNKPDTTLKFIKLSSYIYDTLGGKPFARDIIYQTGFPYISNVLTYFPMMYTNVGNVEGVITYVKIKGIEYGTKMIPEEKTDKTFLKKITCLSKNEIQLDFFAKEPCKLFIKLTTRNKQVIVEKEIEVKNSGLHIFVLDTPDLIQNGSYILNTEYGTGNNYEGASSTFFTVKY